MRETSIAHRAIVDVKTQAAAMKQAMSEDPTWKSLTSPEMLEGLAAAEKSLQDMLSEPFWKQRMLLPNKQFQAYAKTMKANQIVKASKSDEAKTIVANLTSEMELLREQKAVRDKHRQG